MQLYCRWLDHFHIQNKTVVKQKMNLGCVINFINDVVKSMVTQIRVEHKDDSRGHCGHTLELSVDMAWWTGVKWGKKEKRKPQACCCFGAEWDDLTIRFIRGIIFRSRGRVEEKRGKKRGERIDTNDYWKKKTQQEREHDTKQKKHKTLKGNNVIQKWEERQEKRGAQCVLVTQHLFHRKQCRCSSWHRNRKTQANMEDDIHPSNMHKEHPYQTKYRVH